MITTEQRIEDIRSMPPKEAVSALLDIAAVLRAHVEPDLRMNDLQRAFLGAIDKATTVCRRWVNGEAVDGDSLLYPIYNAEGTDVADRELNEETPGYNQDITMVGCLVTNAVLYAASVQYKSEGRERLPNPFQSDFDIDLLVEYVEHDRARLTEPLKEIFDMAWRKELVSTRHSTKSFR